MRWLVFIFVSVMAVAMLGITLLDHRETQALGLFLFLGFPFVWLILGNSVRCPRCGKHIYDNGKGYVAPWIPTPKTCVGCGRSKEDWWPFQWLLKPERDV